MNSCMMCDTGVPVKRDRLLTALSQDRSIVYIRFDESLAERIRAAGADLRFMITQRLATRRFRLNKMRYRK